MKAKILLLMFFFLAIQAADAQIMFQRHYGGNADEYGSSVLQMDDGGYLVASITDSYGAGSDDIYLIRTNEYGDVEWTKTYGGTGDEQPNAMKKTNDGNIIIAGRTSSFGAGSTDCYLLKINQNGDTLWTKTFGGINEDGASDVIQNMDMGFILVGYTKSFSSVSTSVYIIKTNEIGDTLWTKTYEKKTSNTGFSVCQLADDGYFIVGQALLPGQLQTSDCYLIRINGIGDTLWTKTYGGNDYDGAFQCYDTGDGIIISGTTRSFGTGNGDIFLSKFDYDGNNIWYKTYGGINSDYGGSFSPTNDNGYIITGYTESFGAGNQDLYLIKTDNNGDTLWTKSFGDIGNEWGGQVKQTLDNGFIVVGNTSSYGNAYDVYLIKTNSDGVSGIQSNISNNFQIYPNPNNGTFNIQFQNANNKNLSIEILNMNGQAVYKNQFDKACLTSEKIDLSNFSKGIYFVKVQTEDFIKVEKIVIN